VLEESSLSGRECSTSGEGAGGLGVAVVVVVARCVSKTSSLGTVLLGEVGWVSGAGGKGACWLGERASLCEAIHLAGGEIAGVATSDRGFGVGLAGVLVVEGGDPGQEVVKSCAFWGAGRA